ncbi:LytR family transcriptional regulator [bacterium]|nr:LytR family transcriptional regulator [bacterium]
MSAARRAAGAAGKGRWLLIAALALLVISLGLRYLPPLTAGLARVWRWGRERAPAETTAPAPTRAGEQLDVLPAIPLRLQVLNATGVNRLALDQGEALRRWGVDALEKTNAPAWPFPETLLILRSGREGGLAAVRALAERMGGVPVIVQRREDLLLDATLILGHDWEEYHWPEP